MVIASYEQVFDASCCVLFDLVSVTGVLGVGGWDGWKETGIFKVAGKSGRNLT